MEFNMRASIWHHTADRQPEESGYYMAFRTITLADDTCGVDYFYWNKKGGLKGQGEWRTDSTCHSQWVNVYYWTDSDPEKWVDEDGPVRNRKATTGNPALDIAWQRVEHALSQYELIKALAGTEQQ
jgi:hypothetical protein